MTLRSLIPITAGLGLLGLTLWGSPQRPATAAGDGNAATPITILPTGTAVPPNHTPGEARLVAPGAIYAGLQFVPAGNAADFYKLRTKPGNAYALATDVRPRSGYLYPAVEPGRTEQPAANAGALSRLAPDPDTPYPPDHARRLDVDRAERRRAPPHGGFEQPDRLVCPGR